MELYVRDLDVDRSRIGLLRLDWMLENELDWNPFKKWTSQMRCYAVLH